ncbi:MAG: YceH family protein [Acidobacteriota bacterium]|nr:YceH family protein [Acidobacteriota bacterium]
MLTILSDVELRVLGSLIEKQITTPEYYPLTLNALTLACNQKNNRNPVTAYSETTVAEAVESLRGKNLTYVFYGSNSRVPKYKHVMPEIFHLSHSELSLMCVLMLRGAQTVGELHGRSARLFDFRGLEDVEETLGLLIAKDPEPLVVRLGRQPGQKETRFVHLLAGEINIETIAAELQSPRESGRQGTSERIIHLEQEVERISEEMHGLQRQFEEFKKQFE